jgi:hypothetical protein
VIPNWLAVGFRAASRRGAVGRALVGVGGVGLQTATTLGGIPVFVVTDDVVYISRTRCRRSAGALAVGAASKRGSGVDLFVDCSVIAVVVGVIVKISHRVHCSGASPAAPCHSKVEFCGTVDESSANDLRLQVGRDIVRVRSKKVVRFSLNRS